MKKSIISTAILATFMLAVTACSPVTGDNTNKDGLSGLFEDDGCTHITVGTSSEKVNLVNELGVAFKDSNEAKSLSKCVTVKPINVTSGDGATNLINSSTSWPLENEEYWPTVWSPASTIWTDRVDAATGGGVIGDAESFTHTPVVFAMPESMAKALGYPDKPISLTTIKDLIINPDGWGSVGKPLWGKFTISKTNPNTSTTGLSTVLMQAYEAAGKTEDLTVDDVKNAEDFSRQFEQGAIHYGDTTGKVLLRLAENAGRDEGYVSAIAVEETSLINYNMGNADSHIVAEGEVLTPPAEKLVAVYPENGSMWSNNPATVLSTSWVTAEKKAAGEAFVKFLHTVEAQKILPQYGFRPLDTTVPLGDLFTAQYGVNPDQPAVTLPQPETAVVSTALDQWEQVRKPSAVLQLIDISGSMMDDAGNGSTKLDGAISGVQNTIDHFRPTDEVGIWAFTTDISSSVGNNIVPVWDFGPLGTASETIKNDVEDLRNAKKGNTPLYDTLSTAYDYMQAKAETGRINAIVVLSDGEDAGSSTSLDNLLIKLNQTKSEGVNDAPVRIFLIAYGQGANIDVLGKIAKATGGQVFDATDATKIDKVFAQVINNF